MPTVAKSRGTSKRFAVIRTYQPVRIERELLVQVFDLAQSSPVDGASGTSNRPGAADEFSGQHAPGVLIDASRILQAYAPEAVA